MKYILGIHVYHLILRKYFCQTAMKPFHNLENKSVVLAVVGPR